MRSFWLGAIRHRAHARFDGVKSKMTCDATSILLSETVRERFRTSHRKIRCLCRLDRQIAHEEALPDRSAVDRPYASQFLGRSCYVHLYVLLRTVSMDGAANPCANQSTYLEIRYSSESS